MLAFMAQVGEWGELGYMIYCQHIDQTQLPGMFLLIFAGFSSQSRRFLMVLGVLGMLWYAAR